MVPAFRPTRANAGTIFFAENIERARGFSHGRRGFDFSHLLPLVFPAYLNCIFLVAEGSQPAAITSEYSVLWGFSLRQPIIAVSMARNRDRDFDRACSATRKVMATIPVLMCET